jgi:molecular chaperone GrpE
VWKWQWNCFSLQQSLRNCGKGNKFMQNDHQEEPAVNAQNTIESRQPDQPEVEPASELQRQLEAEQARADECLNLLQRTQADFINYKRRTAQEQNEGRTAAQAAILAQILPVLDDLGRAIQSIPPELRNNSWVQGILLVAKRLSDVLEQSGVRQIGQPGEKFDPHWHEAISKETRSDVPEGSILQVYQPGYVLGDRIVRPAQVAVASSV